MAAGSGYCGIHFFSGCGTFYGDGFKGYGGYGGYGDSSGYSGPNLFYGGSGGQQIRHQVEEPEDGGFYGGSGGPLHCRRPTRRGQPPHAWV